MKPARGWYVKEPSRKSTILRKVQRRFLAFVFHKNKKCSANMKKALPFVNDSALRFYWVTDIFVYRLSLFFVTILSQYGTLMIVCF